MDTLQLVIFRPGAIGDTLLCLPALTELRRLYPGATLTFAGNAAVLPLLYDNGVADHVYSFDDLRWARLFYAGRGSDWANHELREQFAGVELAVLWLRDPDGTIVARCRDLGARQVVCAPGRPPGGQRHAAAYLLDTLRQVDRVVRVPPPSAPPLQSSFPPFPLLHPLAGEVAWAEQFWQAHQLSEKEVVLVHPGSGGREKCWPAPSFAALLDWLARQGFGTVLSVGPADDAALAGVQANLTVAQPALLTGVTLGQLAAALRRCAAYVGNDSGISHLSAMLGVPTVALFGPTDSKVWAPLGPQVFVLSAEALPLISVADVKAALREFLPGK